MIRKKKRAPVVVQANCLIGACVNLTLNEHKVLKYIISKVYNINDKNEGLKRYKFLVSDMQKEMSIGRTCMYTDILKHLKALRDDSFTIYDTTTGKSICTSWILEYHYDYIEGLEDTRKYVEVLISDSIQPYLQNLGELYSYTKYELSDISKMTSAYSLILYELVLKELHGRGTKNWNLSLADFRKILGIPTNQYVRSTDLKKRVIDVAVEEINSYTDLVIEYDFARAGVKIIGIKFNVKDSSKSIRRW